MRRRNFYERALVGLYAADFYNLRTLTLNSPTSGEQVLAVALDRRVCDGHSVDHGVGRRGVHGDHQVERRDQRSQFIVIGLGFRNAHHTRSGRLQRLRETMTWGALAALCAIQLLVIYWLLS